MKEQQGPLRISSGVIAAVSVAVIAMGGGVAWLTWNATRSPVSQTPRTTVTQPAQPSPSQPAQEQSAAVYWLQDTGTSLELVSQPLSTTAGETPNQVLQVAFQKLLSGPTEGTPGSTTIPQGTKLLGVKMENDDVHVNLSEEFTTGGGSASMTGRVAQVIYTATSLNSNAKVYIEVNGERLDVLGGEGLELQQPLTRESFQREFSL